MSFSKGSQWHKWDLHVHTPASLVHHYGASADPATWERFFSDIEALPPEFKVIGINDYIFIDGYKKVLEARENGRMSNIHTVLPVIELRLDKFGGSKSGMSRVNYHIIFSDEIPPKLIEAQFIGALHSAYQLNPEHQGLTGRWGGIPDRDSLTDLGNLIIESVPADLKREYDSPLLEGFNALNVSLDKVLAILKGPYFDGKYATAVGKTEWADIKWNDHTIADKKNIINGTDFVFISAASGADARKAKRALAESNVNSRLLDCSDAHRYSTSSDKDRIGNSFTWLKANPTFKGLRQVLNESDGRVFIGDEPDKHAAVKLNKTKYIASLELEKVPDSPLLETWFDGQQVDFNSGLVAIIGNKGSGKSALSDILGLLGSSRNSVYASFLSKHRFKQASDNKAKHFRAHLTWESGVTMTRSLDDVVSDQDVEHVKYIPQSFFETVCNEVPKEEDSAFDGELKSVIFSHVAQSDRLGYASLDALLDHQADSIHRASAISKAELGATNERILELEYQVSAPYKAALAGQLQAKEAELAAHDSAKPVEPKKPDEDVEREHFEILQGIATLTARNEALERELADHLKTLADCAVKRSKADAALGKLANIQRQVEILKAELVQDVEPLGLKVDDILEVAFRPSALEAKKQELARQEAALKQLVEPAYDTCLIHERTRNEAQVAALRDKLNEPNRIYETYKAALKTWTDGRAQILGDASIPGTLEHIRHLQDESLKAVEYLAAKRQSRMEIVRTIFQKKVEEADVYRELYRPVQAFIDTQRVTETVFPLNFAVSIQEAGFKERFFEYISQAVTGSFCGAMPGQELLQSIVERYDFNDEANVVEFIEEIIDHLGSDKRPKGGGQVELASQLKKNKAPKDLYDFIFGLDYLRPRFLLKMGEKELRHLSPGEKGAMLLVFYFLVDKDDTPLIVDQPEENLDNQTIYDLLVPCVKEAKSRRQIFIVTHNPNLAVVCDAEQVICASIDKSKNQQVSYTCGAIEELAINGKILDILEGTRPAFDNRNRKYFAEKSVPQTGTPASV